MLHERLQLHPTTRPGDDQRRARRNGVYGAEPNLVSKRSAILGTAHGGIRLRAHTIYEPYSRVLIWIWNRTMLLGCMPMCMTVLPMANGDERSACLCYSMLGVMCELRTPQGSDAIKCLEQDESNATTGTREYGGAQCTLERGQ